MNSTLKTMNWETLENGNLKFTWDMEERDEFLVDYSDKILENIDWLNSDEAMFELFEYPICNGLSWIKPEDIGALTDSPIIGEIELKPKQIDVFIQNRI